MFGLTFESFHLFAIHSFGFIFIGFIFMFGFTFEVFSFFSRLRTKLLRTSFRGNWPKSSWSFLTAMSCLTTNPEAQPDFPAEARSIASTTTRCRSTRSSRSVPTSTRLPRRTRARARSSPRTSRRARIDPIFLNVVFESSF